MDDECPHGGDPATCPPCHPKPRPQPPTPEWGFDARFPGQCPGCDLPIHVGQTAVKWSDGLTRHLGCDA